MSAYLQEHREEEYAALGKISRTGCWECWIRFFITAILERSRATILDYAFENPLFTIPAMSKALHVMLHQGKSLQGGV